MMGPRGPTPPGMDMRHESVMMGGPSSMGAHSPMGGPMAGPMSGPGASAMGGNPVRDHSQATVHSSSSFSSSCMPRGDLGHK